MRNRLLWLALGAAFTLTAQNVNTSKFRQLGQELPTPNVYRTASGAPGHEYYQQQADYNMSITLDDETQRIYGKETITYTNNSPDMKLKNSEFRLLKMYHLYIRLIPK